MPESVAAAIRFMELAVRQNWRWYCLERERVYVALMRGVR